jgi:two-component system KDP operon response regulator KdpE
MNDRPTILVIDDETQIRRFLRISLEANNYNVIEANCGNDGVYQAAMNRPDMIILDLGLPDMTGNEVLKKIREWSSVPVLILSVQNEESEKIAAFDTGADDYVTKPFAMGELLARVRVALRHAQPSQESHEFRNGHLFIDMLNRVVKVGDNPVQLSPTEYDLLLLFVKHAGKVITHRQIMKEIWGPYRVDETQNLRVYMTQLRKKLELDPSHPVLFATESGVGYRMLLIGE